MATMLNVIKLPYLSEISTDFNQIWYMDADLDFKDR